MKLKRKRKTYGKRALSYIYFGTASATVEEKGEYAVKLYREGNLDKKASVDIHTIDMMALYGEDYELDMEGVRETGDGKSILEKYVKGRAVTDRTEVQGLVLLKPARLPKRRRSRQARKQENLWKQNRKSKALWMPLWANL